ncbi:phosphate ABC transporter substrate-binding protein [Nostoc linckia z18]|uniref:Phosphate-binding protein n=2 Tax=Nostoc linckia TaxID=92942 RepID=A0A9Q5Z4M1_NOSLI|nr:phosphate ABC transporter substrate-binding protein [Nostoc linckia z1]PHJ56294.1 phosphate ABC transporter substrate-binding protein [Nostoc linckia z3]PHJ59541.1 phosphate ABC transporter substrate-binding protein [Nostoc linckia z2]PHJ74098.1 phosphate ABC transporter substrate-binding protein [Nostoc linckia z4]PHJ75344.1 phosphate ABC transporter substrate-binding protein [Nostoc linckia z6]PHJ84136.1 phosphate ABC transporter substrate-binding protein [Nostoc linckia z7]PHJ92792.1 ph
MINYRQIFTATLVATTTINFTTNAAFAQLLRGAGDSFAQPLIERYSQEYEKETGEKFKYSAVGIAGGIRLFMKNSVDFGASTLIPTPIEINQMEDGLLTVPMAGGAVAIVYHLKEVSSDVKLTREQLAKIFTGQISNWQQINSRLPNKKIQVVVNSENSGTSFILTKYLQKITAGKILASRKPDWGFQVYAALSQDSEIAGEVKRIDGAIGYVQTNVALANKLAIASLENQAGKYIKPTLEQTKKALANIKFQQNFTTEDIQDPESGYPLVSLTWLLVHKKYPSQNTLQKTQNLLKWVLTKGQSFNENLGYTKVPEDVTPKLIEAVNNEMGLRPY